MKACLFNMTILIFCTNSLEVSGCLTRPSRTQTRNPKPSTKSAPAPIHTVAHFLVNVKLILGWLCGTTATCKPPSEILELVAAGTLWDVLGCLEVQHWQQVFYLSEVGLYPPPPPPGRNFPHQAIDSKASEITHK